MIVSLCEEVEIYNKENKIFPCREKTEMLFIKQNVLGIRVPSVIIPQECNVIINPMHDWMKSVKILKKESVVIDKRLRPD